MEWSNLSFDFVYDKDGRWVYFVNEIDGSQTYSEIPFLGGRYLASYRSDGTHLTHANRLGSTTMETTAAGGVMEDQLFYPWGQFWQQGTSGWSFASMPYRDQPLGHDLTPNRIYDYGATERWMTPDPAGRGAVHLDDPQTWNMYGYVKGNPTTFTDPEGLDCISTSNHSASSVTVSVVVGGDCSGVSNGTYVNGTVDVNSLTYNGGDISYNWSNSQEGTGGTGVIGLGAPPSSDQLNPVARQVLPVAGQWASTEIRNGAIAMGGNALAIGGWASDRIGNSRVGCIQGG